jgi:hypothetical protein
MEQKKIGILKYLALIVTFTIIPLILISYIAYMITFYFTKSSLISTEITAVTLIPTLLGSMSATRWYIEKNKLETPFSKKVTVYNLDINDGIPIPEDVIKVYEKRLNYFLQNKLYNEYLKTSCFLANFYLKNAIVKENIQDYLKAKEIIENAGDSIKGKIIKNDILQLFDMTKEKIQKYREKFG